MTADNITAERIGDLLALLNTATVSLNRLHRQVLRGSIDHAEAAAIVNQTIANLTNEAR